MPWWGDVYCQDCVVNVCDVRVVVYLNRVVYDVVMCNGGVVRYNALKTARVYNKIIIT